MLAWASGARSSIVGHFVCAMLQADCDDVHAFVAEPARKKTRWADFQRGPRTCEEAFEWPRSMVELLSKQGLEHFQQDFGLRLREAMCRDGLCMRSDYSGMGAPEEALHILCAFFEREMGESVVKLPVVCQRACELLPYARRLLAARSGCCKDACINKDLMERCPEPLRSRLRKLRVQYHLVAKRDIEEGCKAADVYDKLGVQFILEAMDRIFQHHKVRHLQVATPVLADCSTHENECPIFPKPAEGFAGHICNISGITCVDWSAMGSMLKFLGDSAEPFLQWAFERLIGDESFCVVECVPNFDHGTLALLMEDKFDLFCLRVCPSMLGLPILRERKYMILLKKQKIVWEPKVLELGHQAAFQLLFGRFVVMSGDQMLRAPNHAVQAFIAKKAERRGLPRTRRSGEPWSCYLAMSRTAQITVDEHEAVLTEAGY